MNERNRHSNILPLKAWWWCVYGEYPRLRFFQAGQDRAGDFWLARFFLAALDETFDGHLFGATDLVPHSPRFVGYGPKIREDKVAAHREGVIEYRQLLVRADAAEEHGNEDVRSLVEWLTQPFAAPDRSLTNQRDALRVDLALDVDAAPSRQAWPKSLGLARIACWLHDSPTPIAVSAILEELGIKPRTWRNWRSTLQEIPELDLAFTSERVYNVPRHGRPPTEI